MIIVAKNLDLARQRARRAIKLASLIDSSCKICKTKLNHSCSLFRSDTYTDLIISVGTDPSSIISSCVVQSRLHNLQRCPFDNILKMNPARTRITADFLSVYLAKLRLMKTSSKIIFGVEAMLSRAKTILPNYTANYNGFTITFHNDSLGYMPQTECDADSTSVVNVERNYLLQQDTVSRVGTSQPLQDILCDAIEQECDSKMPEHFRLNIDVNHSALAPYEGTSHRSILLLTYEETIIQNVHALFGHTPVQDIIKCVEKENSYPNFNPSA